MPQLIFVALCSRAIIDQHRGQLTLFAMLDEIQVEVPAGMTVPANASLPQEWSFVTIWRRTPEDKDKIFQQRTRVIRPDGVESPDTFTEFKMDQEVQRNIVYGTGIPLLEGDLHFQAWLSEQDSDDWVEAGSFPMRIALNYASSEVSDTQFNENTE